MTIQANPRTRLLFLFGGMPAMAALPAFLAAAGDEDARIVVLAQSRTGWEQHPSSQNEPFITMLADGRARLIAPEDTRPLDIQRACDDLRWATGIHITGGHTPTYQQLFAVEPIRSVIRECYLAGVPYAGLSAGALLAQDIYYAVMFNEDNEEEYMPLPGLGLLPNTLIEAHFTGEVRQKRLRRLMALCPPCRGIGIDEAACVVLRDESMVEVIGEHAYLFIAGNGEGLRLRSR